MKTSVKKGGIMAESSEESSEGGLFGGSSGGSTTEVGDCERGVSVGVGVCSNQYRLSIKKPVRIGAPVMVSVTRT